MATRGLILLPVRNPTIGHPYYIRTRYCKITYNVLRQDSVSHTILLFLSRQGAGVLGKQFQKMRRRLTVTGASQNIDGVAKVGTQEPQEIKKTKKKDKVKAELFTSSQNLPNQLLTLSCSTSH